MTEESLEQFFYTTVIIPRENAIVYNVRGRPTLASAVETKLGTKEEIESRSARWNPPSPTIPVTMTIPIFFDTLIGQLLF